MRIAITGGTGFVGGHITTQLRASGHHVTVLSRQSLPNDPAAIPFSLEAGFQPRRLEGFDVLVHAAYDFHATDDRNIAGSTRLLKAAAAAGVGRIVFVSSLSAFDGCRSSYGATKLSVEKEVSAIGGCIIRLGFVCDDSGRGLSGSLRKLAGLPVIPLPGRGTQVLYTIQAKDLGGAFLRVIERGDCRNPVHLAHSEPVTLRLMLQSLAHQQNKKPIFLPVPWRILWGPLRAAEVAGIHLNFRSDSLVSLMNQNPAPDFRQLLDLNLELQPFAK